MVTCRVKIMKITEYKKQVGNAIVETEKESKDIETGLIHVNRNCLY